MVLLLYRFFQKAALHVLTLLDPVQPVLTLSLWRRACEMNVGITYDTFLHACCNAVISLGLFPSTQPSSVMS